MIYHNHYFLDYDCDERFIKKTHTSFIDVNRTIQIIFAINLT